MGQCQICEKGIESICNELITLCCHNVISEMFMKVRNKSYFQYFFGHVIFFEFTIYAGK